LRHTKEAILRLHAELTGETFSEISLRAFAREWLETKKAETSPRTIYLYRQSVERLLEHLGAKADEPISEVGRADLLKFRNALSERGLASQTVNDHVKCAKMLFKAARRDGLLSEDPSEFIANIPRERNAGIKRPFSTQQLRAVLAVADPEWRSLILFGLYTGQRLGDLARLPFSAIDLNAGELSFRTAKTGRIMAIPLAAPLRKHIESLPWPSGGRQMETPVHPRAFAIIDAQGRSSTLSREFGELLAKAGLRTKRSHQSRGVTREGARTASQLSFHSLRRTATTLLHEAGIPQAVAQVSDAKLNATGRDFCQIGGRLS
jgi:integrase